MSVPFFTDSPGVSGPTGSVGPAGPTGTPGLDGPPGANGSLVLTAHLVLMEKLGHLAFWEPSVAEGVNGATGATDAQDPAGMPISFLVLNSLICQIHFVIELYSLVLLHTTPLIKFQNQ